MTRRDHSHTHPCERCHVATDCSSDLEDNYDGWPEVVCVDYDMHSHDDWFCEACMDLLDRVNDEPELVGE